MHDPTPTPSASLAQATGDSTTARPEETQAAREWLCPGVPLRRKVLTGIGVTLAAAGFFALALWQGASMVVSTIIGAVFIGGFVGYLGVVAPTPFSLRLDATGITRSERGREPSTIAWDRIARIKEEAFKNGRSVSLAVYKRVGTRGVHRAFVVYRDDVNGYDSFHAALRAGVGDGAPWQRETIHE
jgi:hypothetical protein